MNKKEKIRLEGARKINAALADFVSIVLEVANEDEHGYQISDAAHSAINRLHAELNKDIAKKEKTK